MSKGNVKSSQRKPHVLLGVQTREKMPIPFPVKGGGVELHCPFCPDHHALSPDKESPCGTKIEVKAVQKVIPRTMADREKLVCIKCHKVGGGEMVQYRKSFIHLVDCNPETKLLQDVPKFNKLAGIVYRLPARFRGLVERYTGRADQVLEIDENGVKTGKVLGFFFWKYQKE